MTVTGASEAIRPDGLPYEITWRGEKCLVPTGEHLADWAKQDYCRNPHGETVSCDHPDSWLSLCGLLPAKE